MVVREVRLAGGGSLSPKSTGIERLERGGGERGEGSEGGKEGGRES